MPTYKYKCDDCQLIEEHNMSISLFLSFKKEKHNCSCGGNQSQMVKTVGAKMIRDKLTIVQEAKEDARKIVRKMETRKQSWIFTVMRLIS